MRISFFALIIATLALGCGPGPNPNLGPCSARGPGAVILGTGEDEFQTVPSEGVRLNFGNQGGEHIWLALSCKNLGPRVTAFFKITDVETAIEITRHGLAQAMDLEYDGNGSDLAYGLYGYIEIDQVTETTTSGGGGGAGGGAGGNGGNGGASPMLPMDIRGRKIKMEVDVSDDCKKPAIHAEVLTVIAS